MLARRRLAGDGRQLRRERRLRRDVPLTLKRFGADPATASSIFLTTATDVASMGLLLGLGDDAHSVAGVLASGIIDHMRAPPPSNQQGLIVGFPGLISSTPAVNSGG